MKTVTLDSFYKFEDFELSQYQILDCIKKFRTELHQYKLFPGLENLSELILQFDNTNMEEICSNESGKNEFNSDNNFNRDENKTNNVNDEYADKVFALIEWARPMLQELVDEGNIIYEYVENNIELTEISNIKGKKNKGFLLVPDNRNSIVHLMQFHLTKTASPFSKTIINTRLLKSFSEEKLNTSSKILFRKIKGENIDLNKTAVFYCHTDLDFPFSETMITVIKNKLLLMLLE
jgi:hypothetical protein